MLQSRRIGLGLPLLLLLACSTNTETDDGVFNTGGSPPTTTGGTSATSGGSATGGVTGGLSSGGTTGGTTGGVVTGGTSTGGSLTGGTGPTSSGGTTGGNPTAKGGSGSGGASGSGGKAQTGGSGTGGNTGGKSGNGRGGSAGTGGSAGAGAGGRGGSAGSGGTATGGSSGGKSTGGSAGTTGGDPPTKTIRVFWLRPSDVPFDQKYPDGIGKVMLEAQKYYKAELGKTFKLNDPIVETVVGDHVKNWYETTANGGDKYWWSVTNMQNELVRKFGLKNPDSRWMVVGEISAEGDGAGGGGSPGWVILCQHDADGAVGIGGTMNRWYGGMVHELGHAFGLPDAASTDGTPMSASFYDYPNTHFNQTQKNSILNGSQSSFLF
ncbi:MAG TPA: hypothetical protein VG937_30755 [Polyangiaceae bacterium]|nr:hypothetical protein [Polyangiaceae bacterium]